MIKSLEKLRKNRSHYSVYYDHPGAMRTSNMLDRLMQRMDRRLFDTQYFHGHMRSADLGLRGWCLIQNFAPYNPETIRKQSRNNQEIWWYIKSGSQIKWICLSSKLAAKSFNLSFFDGDISSSP